MLFWINVGRFQWENGNVEPRLPLECVGGGHVDARLEETSEIIGVKRPSWVTKSTGHLSNSRSWVSEAVGQAAGVATGSIDFDQVANRETPISSTGAVVVDETMNGEGGVPPGSIHDGHVDLPLPVGHVV